MGAAPGAALGLCQIFKSHIGAVTRQILMAMWELQLLILLGAAR